jgi:asparagine synthase (glutamine-hydrolysing)
VALGHRRLKIVDLSEHAAQPMVDAELGLTIAFNGMVYNYPDCAGSSSRGLPLLLHQRHRGGPQGLRHWGEDFVDHLVGMFACAIVERDRGRVVLARDRLGHQAALPRRGAGALRFASTLPAPARRAGGVDTESTASRCTTT